MGVGKSVQVSVSEGIDRLLGRYLEHCGSPENARRVSTPGVRWSILPEFPLLAEVTGACLRDAYLQPDRFVRFTLAHRIYRFERWEDCTPLTPDISYWPGVILETSAFGMEATYPEAQDPWTVQAPVVRDASDVGKLRAPFDRERGAVRLMLDMSEFCRECLPGFTVRVQAWDRSPVGVAMDLMGAEAFLESTVARPALVRELMQRVVDEQNGWSAARRACLEELGFPTESSVSPGTGAQSELDSDCVNLIADEVNMPMMSRPVYDELVFPYEQQLVARAGRLNYYHSCGCLTPFLPAIATLRPVTQHISAWTDWETAVETFAGTDTVLQKTLHPMRDVLGRDAPGMTRVMKGIQSTAGDRVKYCLVANGIDNPSGNLGATLAACDEWVAAAARCMN